MTNRNIEPEHIADYERVGTHWHGCWRHHFRCAIAQVERLEDAVRMMCTEMPVGWPELAAAEGWGHVATLVQEVIDHDE